MSERLAVLGRRWNALWFTLGPTHGLSLVRIVFGLAMLLNLTGLSGLYRIGELTMRFPDRPVFAIGKLGDGYPMPYPGLGWLPVPSPGVFAWLEVALLALTVLMIIGLVTRVVVPTLAIAYGYLFLTDQWNYHHHKFLAVIVLAILACSRCGEHFSVDAVLRGSARLAPAMVLPLRLLQALVVLVYTFTCLSKVEAGWLSGRMIQMLAAGGEIQGPFAPFVLDLLGPQALGIATVVAEAVIPLALLHSRTRRLAIFTGVALHLGIDALMDVGTFSYQMMALYVAFIYPAAGATVALYDGQLPQCRRWPRWAALMDWFRRFTWLDTRDPQVRVLLPADVVTAASNDLVLINPTGEVLTGSAAWRSLVNRFPLTFMPSALLYVPPVRQAVDLWWTHKKNARAAGSSVLAQEREAPAWEATLREVSRKPSA